MKTIVVGLGNPILGDDGVGWVVAEEVRKQIPPEWGVDLDCLSLGGISLMECLIGYDHVILVDAFLSNEPPGSIIITELNDILDVSAFHLTSSHDMSLQNAMKLGRQMGVKLPVDVKVVGISARHVYDFGEELSPSVRETVPKVTRLVVELLAQKITIL